MALWDCREIARQLVSDGVVGAISAETVRRVLADSHLKPWQVHAWLSPKVPRDAGFAAIVREVSDLYTRTLADDEVVLCVDEKTNLQPRGRTAWTLPPGPRRPARLEHEYVRGGALHLFAAFDTRTGEVVGWNAARKRAAEFVSFLDLLDAHLPHSVRTVHLVLDNLRVHKGRAVKAWLADHPRFVLHFPPVHCSWMNQIEQWFAILQRKALRAPNFENTVALDRHLHRFISHWNRSAHPFNWTTGSIARVLAKCSLDDTLSHAA